MTWIELEGAVNVRDVGGLPTVDGRTTRPGVLLRADNLQSLTEADVEALVDRIGVRTVVDLRTDGERTLEGPTPLEGRVALHGLSLVPERPDEDPARTVDRVMDAVDGEHEHASAFDRALPRPDRRKSDGDMSGFYIGYVQDAPENLAAALRLIADPASGPVVVHCAAGKDRTGTVVALALSLAGVTRDAVVADYARSAERAEAILERLRASATYRSELSGVTADMVAVKPEWVESLLDWVDREYGGPHGLAVAVGVDEETVERLVRRLVGPSEHGER